MRSTRKKALFLLALASTTLMACGHTEEPSTSVEPTTSVTPTTSEPSSNTTPTPSTSTPEPSTSTVEGPEMNTSDALKLLMVVRIRTQCVLKKIWDYPILPLWVLIKNALKTNG